jgi:nucleotide-binding universal stress UspA family protein
MESAYTFTKNAVTMSSTIYHKLLVGLDLTDFDNRVLRYIKDKSQLMKAEKAYFIHVSPSLEIPVFLQKDVPSPSDMPLDEQAESLMRQKVDNILADVPMKKGYEVIEGGVTKQLLHWIDIKGVDLAVMGRRKAKDKHATSAKRFVRHAECDVMFIPNNDTSDVKRIVVATDFSENSQWALQKAAQLARLNGPETEIVVLHVYDIPPTLHNQIGRTEDQFDAYYRSSLDDFMKRFLAEESELEGLKVSTHLLERGDTTLAHEIARFMDDSGADLLVMGAKGHNDLDVFFLGSFTEQVLGFEETFPLLVVKTPLKKQDLISSMKKEVAKA